MPVVKEENEYKMNNVRRKKASSYIGGFHMP
jgi:hypothetical protein